MANSIQYQRQDFANYPTKNTSYEFQCKNDNNNNNERKSTSNEMGLFVLPSNP